MDIATPVIIDEILFDRVQGKLVSANPKVTPPRVTTGPILLTGLAKCAHCGGGMTQRTGTSSTGRVYAYYTCAARAQKGPSVCKGNSIPMAFLDTLVLDALKAQLFTPERLSELLAALVERRQARDAALHRRLAALKSEMLSVEERLKRLYRSIEDGIVELDDILRDRIADLKAEREKVQATYARETEQASPTSWATPESIAAF